MVALPTPALAHWFNTPNTQKVEAQTPFKAHVQWNSNQLQTGEVPAAWVQDFPQTDWWTQFNDEPLNQLMTVALTGNPAMLALQQRVVQAESLTMATRSVLLPQVDLGGSYLLQQYAKDQFVFPLSGRTFHSAQVPLTVSFELDPWGKNRDLTQMTRLGIDGAKYAYQAYRLQLAAQVAATYFQLAKWQALQASQTQLMGVAQKALFHTRQLFFQKQVSASQVDQTEMLVNQTRAELDGLTGLIAITQQQLTTLTGRSATTTSPSALTVTPLQAIALPQQLAAGVPAALVAHRPDVAREEVLIEVSRLNINVAKKSMLPTFKLNGSTGYAAVSGWNKLFDVSNISSFISPSISQPVFRGGVLKNGITLRKAEYEQLVQEYKSVMLNAFQEAENSLAQWQTSRHQLQALARWQQDVTRQAEHAQRTVQQGQAAEPVWLAAEAQRIMALKTLDTQTAQLLTDTVSVYKALGGGFERSEPPNAHAKKP
jgi:NodT family efflux transporter outer membrane factor (OMF) lipoprotein